MLSEEPPNAEAAEGAFADLITPAQLRFVRCHHPVPEIGADHQVELCGAVLRPQRLGIAALRCLPQATVTVVTECAGNGRSGLAPPVAGEQWGAGAVSAARWTGVPLAVLLERAGLESTALELVFTGADGGAYQRSLPREVAQDSEIVVALEMNGEPIASRFGGPLRAIVPGWYGMASVKWLSRIEAVEAPFVGPFQTGKYVYAPGVPVSRVRVKSMFTSVPALRCGVPARIEGLAWGGDRVARVEVAPGSEWLEARLCGPALPYAFRRFELFWTPPASGRYLLRCRATDASGVRQPARAQWNEGGYGANAIQQLPVVVF